MLANLINYAQLLLPIIMVVNSKKDLCVCLIHVQAAISKKYYAKYLAVMKRRPSCLDTIISPLTSESGVAITCTFGTSFGVWKEHQRKKLDRYVRVPSLF